MLREPREGKDVCDKLGRVANGKVLAFGLMEVELPDFRPI